MMEDDQQFCLRWNNHQATLISVFDKLLEKGMHVDCTLAAEGQTLNAHKVVLSACSPYFESVLAQQYDKHPIIILKDVKYAELRAMMDYMYRGEVNISQDQLAALLKAAESLQIKGLSDNKPAQPNTTPIKQSCDSISGDTEDECRSNTSSPSSAAAPRKRRKRSTSTENNNIIPSVLDTNSSSNPPSTIQNNQPIHNGRTHVTDLTNEDDPPSTSALHSDVVQNFQWHMEQSRDDQSEGQRDSQVKSVEKLETEEPVKKTRSKATVDEALPNIDKSVAVIAEDRRVTRNSNVRRSKRLAEETQQQQVTTYAVLTNAIIKKEAPPPAAVPIPQTPAPSTDSPPTNPVTPLQEKKQPEELKDEESKEKLIRFYLEPKKNRLPCSQFLTTKGYKCPNCPKLYNARKNLVRHISLECGREPQFKCPECSSRKHRRNELKRHIQKKHPEAFIKHESDEKSD